jgi:heterodisulfide reductase subunit C
MALRSLSQDEGYFTESEKGRQQLALKRTIGEWILKYGYCIYPRHLSFDMHPEAGPVWKWEQEHIDDVFERIGGNLDGNGPGILRKIPDKSLDELRSIFDLTGATGRFEKIETASAQKASEMGLDGNEYFVKIYNENSGEHY